MKRGSSPAETRKSSSFARVIAFFRAGWMRYFQILHRRLRFAGRAIERSHQRKRCGPLSGRICALESRCSRASIHRLQVHQRHSLGVMLFGGLQCRNRRSRNTLSAQILRCIWARSPSSLLGPSGHVQRNCFARWNFCCWKYLKSTLRKNFNCACLAGAIWSGGSTISFWLSRCLAVSSFSVVCGLFVGSLGSPDRATFHGHSPRKTMGNIARSRWHVNVG